MNFMLGVNYWPRHKGVDMWREFDIEQIDSEFAQIKSLGMNTVRIFPLWRDFQPIKKVRNAGGLVKTLVMRHNEQVTPLQNYAMIDQVMAERFRQVMDCAEKHRLQVIVALLTAWMSGILFDVEWRDEKNVFSDPFMLKWQLRYCEYMVKKFRNCSAILAWEYGNEQNNVNLSPSADASWNWMKSIADVIRLNDSEHPIYSGMHGLTIHNIDNARWTITDNAEINDMLTTHSYADFTIGCNLDQPTDMRPSLHATAESLLYQGLSGKSVLCEETGSLGSSVMDEEMAGDFIRLRLYSLLANGIKGCLWWCYSDFSVVDRYPYKAIQMENDRLGLTAVDGRVKSVAEEYRKFAKILSKLGGKLPAVERKTAIVVADNSNDWRPYYNAFVLCKQAGLEAEFVYPATTDLTHYKLLLCVAVRGYDGYDVNNWQRIMGAVEAGAILYFSSDGASIATPRAAFGIARMRRVRFPQNLSLTMHSITAEFSDVSLALPAKPEFYSEIIATTAEPLAVWDNQVPALQVNEHGQGKIIYAGVPIEKLLAETPYVFDKSEFHQLYIYLKHLAGIEQQVEAVHHQLESIWHQLGDNSGYLTVINYTPKSINASLQLKSGCCLEQFEFINADSETSIIDNKNLVVAPLSCNIFKINLKH